MIALYTQQALVDFRILIAGDGDYFTVLHEASASTAEIREIELGTMLGNSYVVMSGLKEGEEVVTQGAFSVDASAQLEGKPSMMNPSGEKVSSMPDGYAG